MKPAIRVENLSKLYHIGSLQRGPRTLKAALAESLAQPWRKLQKRKRRPAGKNGETEKDDAEPDTIWALKDVSFEVQPGEVLGVLGVNGSGKTTLMKVLSRVTTPTSGRVEVRGRVGSLLEVGTGFDPEFTGRENIHLTGPILGMSRKEIDDKFEQIVKFADIEKFLDTPVKHYSSGMQLRLGFAVAAHLDPEILLIDEALSVGDESFQRRCLERMMALAKSGKTVVIVSHATTLLADMCHRAIVLKAGRIQLQGPTASVIKEYQSSLESAGLVNGQAAHGISETVEEQLSDLLETPPDQPPIAPLAHEVASTLLTYLPSMLADEFVHRLGPPLAGYVAEYLATSLPEVMAYSAPSVTPQAEPPNETELNGAVEMGELDLAVHVTPPSAQPLPAKPPVFQLRNWENPFTGCHDYLAEANKRGLDVNDWLEEYLGWGNARLIVEHTVRPLLADGMRICEFCPGTGFWARHVAARLTKADYWLLESDPWLVEFLFRYFRGHKQIKICPFEGCTLPFPDAARFDLALALDVFCGYSLGKIDLFAREFARILRPGGRCVIQYADPTAQATWEFLRKYGTRPTGYADAFAYHSPEIIDRVFASAGFKVERRVYAHEYYPGYPFTALIAVRQGMAS
jgi:ABC-type polysaccharide/polyol phosphate transport system ATPase subunit/SAM-dependent methyltransferase